MTARFFADTNVAIYTLDVAEPKSQQAVAVMQRGPIISTQVVNEFLSVLLSKRKLGRPQAHELARALMQLCDVVSVTPAITAQAMTLSERYQLSHWDSLIVAAALETGCEILYTEDMQDGQEFEGRLTVKNPFAET